MSDKQQMIQYGVTAAAFGVTALGLIAMNQPNEVSCIIGAVAAAGAHSLAAKFTDTKKKPQSYADLAISDEEPEEEETVRKPKKKHRSRAAAKKKARELNRPQREAEKKRREAAQAIAKAEKERKEAEAARQAADDAAQESKAGKKKKKKKKNKKKGGAGASNDASGSTEKDEKKNDDEGWEQVPIRPRKGKSSTTEGSDGSDDESTNQENLRIDPKHYGTIIGSKGSTLALIESATGCSIKMPKKGMMNHDLILLTGAPEAILKARETIEELVENGYSQLTHPSFTCHSLEVAASQHRLIVGRGGANIKAVQRETNTRINLPKEDEKNEVTIVGEIDGVLRAKRAIVELLDKGYSSITHPTWERMEVPFPNSALSSLIGPRGSSIRKIEEHFSCKITTPDGKNYVVIIGPRENLMSCSKQVRAMSVVEEAPVDPAWAASYQEYHKLNSWDVE